MSNSEYLEFIDDAQIYSLGEHLWCGAKERWDEADWETREAVFDRVCEYAVCHEECNDGKHLTLTQINDLIWFECDDLFFPKFYVEIRELDEDGDETGDSEETEFDNMEAAKAFALRQIAPPHEKRIAVIMDSEHEELETYNGTEVEPEEIQDGEIPRV